MSRRHRIAEGIYRDQYGLAATVKVGRIQRERRFQSDADLETLKSWRIQQRALLDAARVETPRRTGTLAHDAERFLAKKKGAIAFKSDRAHLRAWLKVLGPVKRSAITSDRVELQMAEWRTAKVAARTIRHRLRVLRECYRSLDGPKARTPVDGVKMPAVPSPNPASVPLKMMQTVARNLKLAGLMKDYARFLVRATTGQRPAQIMRATADDVDLARRVWYVRPAKQGHPIPMPLNAEMVKAWRVYARASAWGAFDTARAAKILRAHGWPKGVKPYSLRHTFAIDLLLSGADLGDVQGLLGHRQIQTTRAHYAPILAARLRSVTQKRRLKLA